MINYYGHLFNDLTSGITDMAEWMERNQVVLDNVEIKLDFDKWLKKMGTQLGLRIILVASVLLLAQYSTEYINYSKQVLFLLNTTIFVLSWVLIIRGLGRLAMIRFAGSSKKTLKAVYDNNIFMMKIGSPARVAAFCKAHDNCKFTTYGNDEDDTYLFIESGEDFIGIEDASKACVACAKEYSKVIVDEYGVKIL